MGLKKIIELPKLIILKFIKIYQKTLSLDHGFLKFLKPHGQCKYYPTCSEYSEQSISKYGVLRGGWKSLKRILRCNPLSRGGYDPVE